MTCPSWLSLPPPDLEQEDDTGVAEVKVAMPFTLKKQLMTDWENVTQEPRRLVKLPRELTAANVMSQYMESKADRSTPPQIARAQELIDGVRIYFDKVRMSYVWWWWWWWCVDRRERCAGLFDATWLLVAGGGSVVVWFC